jgi:signal recognition particle receptor subunit beta
LVLFNYALKELTAKIVYYGPGLSGKTSNLQYIYEELPIKNKGRMLTLATETDRTLYFDFLPVDAGVVRGIKTRVQLYTVPGQVFYNATRRMVLKGADGVVFVADSQKSMVEANLESFENLRENLKAHDLRIEEMPLVLQFNKRDLQEIETLEAMNESLNPMNAPFYEAVAKDGIGVEETLQAISGLVLKSVIDRYGGDRTISPMGSMAPAGAGSGTASKAAAATTDPARTDPARTDPDALVSATAARSAEGKAAASAALGPSGGRAERVSKREGLGPQRREEAASTGGRGDAPKQPPASWPSVPKEDPLASKESNPLDAFETLNIEGILDEALRLDEPDEVPVRPGSRAKAKADSEPAPSAEEDSIFSGLLDEALGGSDSDSILDSVFGEAASAPSGKSSREREKSDPMREIEVELLGSGLEPADEVEESVEEREEEPRDNRSHLSELIKTRVSIPTQRHAAKSSPESAPAPAPTKVPIEVPVTIHIDADAAEQEVELLLKIRIQRK